MGGDWAIRIAQVAPLYESVPPKMYGGTERVVSVLTDELVRRGHDVTLFASGDSTTLARLVPIVPNALRLSASAKEPHAYQMLEMGKVFEQASQFDVIHCHTEYFSLPFTRLVATPVVTTLHGRLDLLELQPIFTEYRDANLVSVSYNQRKPLPYVNWVATVYNGIDVDSLPFERRRGDYLAFLGRISPEKGIEWAVEVAKRTGIPLKVAAKVDPADVAYYESRVRPLLDHQLVEYIGEIDQVHKGEFLRKALALIFPIHWPEPFGLVVVESLACGTPVIAGRFGSMPEIIEHGKTGFICESLEEMVLACGRISEISPYDCRNEVEKRFSARVMAAEYERVYARMIAAHRPRSRAHPSRSAA